MGNDDAIFSKYCFQNSVTRDHLWFRYPHLRLGLDVLEKSMCKPHAERNIYPAATKSSCKQSEDGVCVKQKEQS